MAEEEYTVEDILDKRTNRKGKIEYLVKWENYPVAASTWEPLEHLTNSMDIIRDFEARQAGKEKTEKSLKPTEGNAAAAADKYSSTPGNPNKPQNAESSSGSKTEKSEEIQILRDIDDNIPKKINSVKKFEGELFSLVEWEERSDGLTPDPAYIPSMLLRKLNPKLLIQFYESKIKFVNKK